MFNLLNSCVASGFETRSATLYRLQKLLYELNRDPRVQEAFLADSRAVLTAIG